MKDMIYYPGFETKDENWLKFALLYFDTLRPIIPYTICSEKKYLSGTFQYVMGETDLIRPWKTAGTVWKTSVYREMFVDNLLIF